MKDITITSARISRELLWLLGGFVLSLVLNIYSILKYDTAWKELVTKIHVVIILALIFYFLALIIRLLVGTVQWLVTGKKFRM